MLDKALQLTIYLDETDMHKDMALYEMVVRRLLHLHVAGATVCRGIMGFGTHGQVHRQRLFGVSDDRPVMIIVVDREEKIREVLPEVKRLVKEGLITIAPVEIVFP